MSLAVGIEVGAFLVGLLLGSFLNVCISRLPEHRSIVRPGSHCPGCGVGIKWYDNVPVVSWLVLRGRCRACGVGISWRYPAVELGVGLWFLQLGHVIVRMIQLTDKAAAYSSAQGFPAPAPIPATDIAPFVLFLLGSAILGFLLIGLMVIDWRTHKLPDAFTLTGTGIGFVLVCCQAVFLGPHEGELLLKGKNPLSSPGNVVDRGNVVLTGPEHLVLGRLLAIVCAAGIVLAIRFAYQKVRGREGMGLGDAKLMGMIAAFLGFWPAVLAMFVGVVLCSGYALGLMVRGPASGATRLPLGSFLAVGGLVSAVVGCGLIAWYRSLL
jgi:leader peptidase (prepilin peptidase)/N-methyltransferase